MSKELVIIFGTPAKTSSQIEELHHLPYFLRFFDKVRVLYWAKKEEGGEVFIKKEGRFVFYPYDEPYDSGYVTGVKFMFWIGKSLLRMLRESSSKKKLVFMTVIPIWPGIPTLMVGKLKGKKTVLRLEAQKIDYVKKEERLEGGCRMALFFKILVLNLVYYLTIPFFDVVIGISEGVSEEARRYGAGKVVTIPNPVDLDFFSPPEKKEGLEKKTPTLLYVGQIKKVKGVHHLIRVVGNLEKKGTEVKLLIAGAPTNPKDQDYFKTLKTMSAGLDVEFLGWVSHKRLSRVYKRADIFVLPSYTEALGKATMEAMASGLPVVATATSGTNYLVKEGVTGLIIPLGDHRALEQKIRVLVEDPELRREMGGAARKRIEEIMEEAEKNNEKLWKNLV